MSELMDDFTNEVDFERLMRIQEIVVERFAETFDPVASIAEEATAPQIESLELFLHGLVSEQAYKVYEQIDVLVAQEKRQLMLTCYLLGAASMM